MKYLAVLVIVTLASCVPLQSVYRFSRDNKLEIRKVSSIDLFPGHFNMAMNTEQGKDPIYLLYENGKLKYLTAKKQVQKDYVYRIGRVGDTITMLTRSGWNPRYFAEDTVLFHTNYVVQSVCLYSSRQPDEIDHKYVHARFTATYLTNDSILIFHSETEKPLFDINSFGMDSAATNRFLSKQSNLIKRRRVSRAELVRQILRN